MDNEERLRRHRISDKKYRDKHREEINLKQKKYRQENKEKISEYGIKLRARKETKERLKKWREDNKESLRLKALEWRTNNSERKKEIDKKYYYEKRKDKLYIEREQQRLRDFRKNNQDRIIKYNEKYYQSPKGKIYIAKQNHIRLARHCDSPTDLTIKRVEEIYKRDGGCCVYCGSIRKLELDHVVPLAKGGSSMFDNFVIACKKCNTSKSAKDVYEWCKEKNLDVPKVIIQMRLHKI